MTSRAVRDTAPFTFGTKAETLARIGPYLDKFVVPRSYHFALRQWRDDPGAVLNDLSRHFPDETVIVRSSAHGEDGADNSMAGQFESIANVSMATSGAVEAAITKVITAIKPI